MNRSFSILAAVLAAVVVAEHAKAKEANEDEFEALVEQLGKREAVLDRREAVLDRETKEQEQAAATLALMQASNVEPVDYEARVDGEGGEYQSQQRWDASDPTSFINEQEAIFEHASKSDVVPHHIEHPDVWAHPRKLRKKTKERKAAFEDASRSDAVGSYMELVDDGWTHPRRLRKKNKEQAVELEDYSNSDAVGRYMDPVDDGWAHPRRFRRKTQEQEAAFEDTSNSDAVRSYMELADDDGLASRARRAVLRQSRTTISHALRSRRNNTANNTANNRANNTANSKANNKANSKANKRAIEPETDNSKGCGDGDDQVTCSTANGILTFNYTTTIPIGVFCWMVIAAMMCCVAPIIYCMVEALKTIALIMQILCCVAFIAIIVVVYNNVKDKV